MMAEYCIIALFFQVDDTLGMWTLSSPGNFEQRTNRKATPVQWKFTRAEFERRLREAEALLPPLPAVAYPHKVQ